LAPGEGDSVPAESNGEQNGGRAGVDALRVVRGEVG
jgi:hypothetical protein